ncbi:phosphate regulon sensor histidine kinase PhoR [Neisseria dentiae]|uniref:Phosphate regulon sensor protein PhoR n=1 Tax=Neisseria dentiae TaxID=194197 RepID=A0A1X3DD85_9NEIS|nr:phosphate regulon sensor histidine kinase PhoR [Neisseria dentiae]OSI17860.1 phosphate regulon sensor histidine kinase PhoR [Neisseria dentiae]QMT45969.1 phosphate regulon sensor histidine kinase PhoR [Neisseria dentiae]STZ51992.1 two-component system sensor kinase [Neisseria dentiae]
MNLIRRHLLGFAALLLAAAIPAYLLGGFAAVGGVWSLLLFAYLLLHWFHLVRLIRWLANPKLRLVPRGYGIWDDIFNTLLLQAKSRKKRKQQLGRSLQRFNRVIDAMPDGVIILDQEGRIEWMNRLAAVHLDLDFEKDQNGILKNLIRTPEFHSFLQQPLDDTPPTLKIRLSDGLKPRSVMLTRTTFETRLELLVTQDISAAEQLNETRSAFIANVSHELRTPLTVISGFLETLADLPDLPPGERAEFIGLMQQESNRMLNLITDLLTLARLENSGGGETHKQTFSLSELAEQICAEGRALSDGRHQFQSQIAENILVHGTESELHSALGNLVANAVRYTPEGGSITVSLHDNGSNAEFSVRDTGPGITPEHLPHLTERFYRADAGRNRKNGGTGLGLAIAKHALANHHAVLNISSSVGEGSTFSTKLEKAEAVGEP